MVTVVDKYGNWVESYPHWDGGKEDYEMTSFQFRANLGISVHSQSQRFGLEFYPMDFAIDQVVRHTFSINGVVRIF